MAQVPQGTLATAVNPTNWNVLVDAINANSAGIPQTITTFTDGDTDPTVADTDKFVTGNTGATSITTFDDGTDGQRITITAGDGNTTFVNGATLKYNAGVDITLDQYDVIEFVLETTVWCCCSLSLNT